MVEKYSSNNSEGKQTAREETKERWYQNILKKNFGKGSSDSYFPTFQKAGATAGRKTLGSLRSFSLLFTILGIIHFIFIRNTSFHILLSAFVLLPLGAAVFFNYLKSKGVIENTFGGWVVIIAFLIWYFALGRTLSTLILVLAVIGSIAALWGITTKGSALTPIAAGFIPVLFFFLDVSLLSWAVEQIGWTITPKAANLFLLIPWWAVLGFFCLPTENMVANIFKLGFIIYITFVIIVPYVPTLGHVDTVIPGPEKLLQTETKLREQISPAEIALSSAICFGQTLGNVGAGENYEACVKKRQEESQWKAACKKEGYTEDTPSFTQCVDEQRKLKEDLARQASGVIDTTIKEPTKAEIKFDTNNFPKSYDPLLGFPFEVTVENPRRRNIQLEAGCNFQGISGTASVSGKIDSNTADFADTSFKQTYFCFPDTTGPLKGDYKLQFTAKLFNLNTQSRITRAFIGDKTVEQKDEIIPEINRAISVAESQAPAEFARINFWIGHAANEKIIEDKPYKTVLLTSNIENLGNGKIISVREYIIDLLEMSVDDSSSLGCIRGPVPQSRLEFSQKIVPLITCKVIYPDSLKSLDPQEWVSKTFKASLNYDYILNVSTPIAMKQVTLTS